MTAALIAARGLGVTAGGRRILYDVDLSVGPGEIVTVVGPNGSGKTTLMRALIGALRPSAGEVWRRPGLRIGYAPQRLAIDRTMPLTVARFLALGGPGDRVAALEAVGMAGRGGAQVTDLSGGELQRTLLARALMRRPDVMVLDEPTQGLDQPGAAAFYRLVAQVRDQTGAAVLMVSHDLTVVMSASDRVVCLNGHVCCAGAPTLVSAMPEYRALFGQDTDGALALYRHLHDHAHGAGHGVEGNGAAAHGYGAGHDHGHDRGAGHDHGAGPAAGVPGPAAGVRDHSGCDHNGCDHAPAQAAPVRR